MRTSSNVTTNFLWGFHSICQGAQLGLEFPWWLRICLGKSVGNQLKPGRWWRKIMDFYGRIPSTVDLLFRYCDRAKCLDQIACRSDFTEIIMAMFGQLGNKNRQETKDLKISKNYWFEHETWQCSRVPIFENGLQISGLLMLLSPPVRILNLQDNNLPILALTQNQLCICADFSYLTNLKALRIFWEVPLSER